MNSFYRLDDWERRKRRIEKYNIITQTPKSQITNHQLSSRTEHQHETPFRIINHHETQITAKLQTRNTNSPIPRTTSNGHKNRRKEYGED
jgi:hypothetical protein